MTDLYDMITDLFTDPVILKDLNDFSLKLYDWTLKDEREINELIAFYGNMILEKQGLPYNLKTTRYNEKIFLTVYPDNLDPDINDLRNNDFSYVLIVDKSDYFDHDTLETYQDSFRSYLTMYIEKVLKEILPDPFNPPSHITQLYMREKRTNPFYRQGRF